MDSLLKGKREATGLAVPVETRVYKKRGAFGPLGELSRAHNAVVSENSIALQRNHLSSV
jgi:hypothetical protein